MVRCQCLREYSEQRDLGSPLNVKQNPSLEGNLWLYYFICYFLTIKVATVKFCSGGQILGVRTTYHLKSCRIDKKWVKMILQYNMFSYSVHYDTFLVLTVTKLMWAATLELQKSHCWNTFQNFGFWKSTKEIVIRNSRYTTVKTFGCLQELCVYSTVLWPFICNSYKCVNRN